MLNFIFKIVLKILIISKFEIYNKLDILDKFKNNSNLNVKYMLFPIF